KGWKDSYQVGRTFEFFSGRLRFEFGNHGRSLNKSRNAFAGYALSRAFPFGEDQATERAGRLAFDHLTTAARTGHNEFQAFADEASGVGWRIQPSWVNSRLRAVGTVQAG